MQVFTPIGPEVKVNTHTTGPQYNAKVISLSDGSLVVAWESYDQDGSGFGIYGQRYSNDGIPIGSEFQINTYTAGDQSSPLITALSNGGFVVTWGSYNQDGSGWGLYGQRFDANGNQAGAEFQINTYTQSWQYMSDVISLKNGAFVVTWTSESQDRDSGGIYAQRYSAEGTPAGAEFRINTHTTGDQRLASGAALADGGFVVAWTSSGQDGSGKGVYAQRFSADGTSVGAEFQVNTYTWHDQWGPMSVTGTPDGGFVITWVSDVQDGGYQGHYGQRYDQNGNPVGGEFEAGYDDREFYTELQDGSFLMVTDKVTEGANDPDVYFQRFRLNDTPEATDVVLPDGIEDIPITITAGQLLAGASDANGDVLSVTDLVIASGGGTLIDNGNSTWTYIPRKNYSGPVSFNYAVDDGSYPAYATARITFASANDAPHAIQLNGSNVAENSVRGVVIGTLSANDIDSDTFNFSLLNDAGGRFVIQGNQLAVANGALLDFEQAMSHQVTVRVIDSQGATFDQSFTLSVTDVFNETVYGSATADRIVGGAGRDVLSGGGGNDVLTGGKGKDAFVFDAKLGTWKTDRKVNFDKIADFNVKDDSIWLDNAIFKKLGKGSLTKPVKLKKDFFVVGTQANDKNDYLIYNKKTGIISYDADGSGKGQAIEFAQVKKGLALKYDDFFVV